VRLAYGLYAVGKALHLALLITGTLRFAHGTPSARMRRTLFAGSALLAAALALPSADVRALMLVQAPVMALGLGLACALFARLPAERRDVGTRTAALALAAGACLWALYTLAFAQADGVTWPVRRDLWTALLNYNSYLDLSVMIALAAGLSAALQLDAQRRLRALQREREALAEELARDEKLRALGTLVSGVAHELNNPLAGIQAAAEELRGVERSSVRRARLDELLAEVRRTSAIVETLTGLRHGGGTVRERQNAGALAARVLGAAREQAGARGVALELDGELEAELVVEARAIERALAALVDNALRASPRGGRVRVEVQRDEHETSLRVDDLGPGVPLELQARVFEPFFTTRADDGHLGLGLSVAHATARTHGGSLTLEARERGARFVLRLPHEPAAAHAPARLPAAPREATGPLRLVVVDDEPMLREVLRAYGQRQGWQVECAADGDEALGLLASDAPPPDCVLCDLRMPGLDGRELLRRVRERDPALAERFLFQSGDVSSSEAQAVARETGLPVLEKPLSFARLREWIEGAAARRTAGAAR